MPKAAIIFLILVSLSMTALAYWRAHRLHRQIEEIHPGFNAIMRGCRRRKRG